MIIDDFLNLPDEMKESEVEQLFINVINEYVNKKISLNDFLTIIVRLVEIQSMNYQLIDSNIKSTMDNIISSICDLNNVKIVGSTLVYIILNLGLQNSYNIIRDSIKLLKDVNIELYTHLSGLLVNVGEDISNPYAFLEKYR